MSLGPTASVRPRYRGCKRDDQTRRTTPCQLFPRHRPPGEDQTTSIAGWGFLHRCICEWRQSLHLAAKPLDYLIVLAIKAPSFLGSVVAQFFALALYGIAIPFLKLMLFLPLVFLAAALPIAVALLGTSQAAWLLFFSGNATAARILAYSLAAHFTFMFCNGLIGLCFLPRATRELTAIEEPA